MNIRSQLIIVAFSSLTSAGIFAQQSTMNTELELGAIFTSGNTDDENVKYGLEVDWDRGDWDYRFTSEGLRSSKDNELAAQKLYHVGRVEYDMSETSFIRGRLAYEDDRFSGYDYQSDASINYGRSFFNTRDNMTLDLEAGLGIRKSESETDDFEEAIIRFEGNYGWDLSETATFTQDFAIEAGDETSIYRSVSAVETDILANLALRFSVKVKHQTDVPPGRKKTDTETAVTVVLSF